MMENLPDLQKSQTLVAELLEAVRTQEGSLAGGEADQITRGITAIERLKQTKVTFGNPNQKLLPLSQEALEKMGLKLDYATQQQMLRYDLYSMTLMANWQLAESVAISSLNCNLDFGPHNGGANEPIIHDIFPNSAYQTVLQVTTGAKVGFNPQLKFSFGVDATQLATLPGEFAATVESENSLKAAVEIPEQTRQVGQLVLEAVGVGAPNCRWNFRNPENQVQTMQVEFRVVFQVPKGWESLDLVGSAWVEPSIRVWTGELSHVIDAIPGYLKNKFGNEKKAAKEFAVGCQERWINDSRIILPKA